MNNASDTLPTNTYILFPVVQNHKTCISAEKRKIEILLVDDSEDDAFLTMRELKRQKLVDRVIHLRDGDEILNFLRNEESYINGYITDSVKIILLDLRMPKISGQEVLRNLKSDVLTMFIPVVVLAFADYDPGIDEGYELGAYSHIVKPFRYANFSEIIAHLNL